MSPTESTQSDESLPIAVPRTRIGRRWLDMPLRRKVLTIVVLVALACLPPFLAGLLLNERLDAQRSDTREVIEAIDDLSGVRATLQEAEGAYQFYGISGFTDAGQFETYRAQVDALPSRLDDLQAGLPAGLRSEGREVAGRAAAMVERLDAVFAYGAAGNEPADLLDDPELTELNPRLIDELVVGAELNPEAYGAVDALDSQLEAALEDGRAEVDDLQRNQVWVMLTSLVVALVGASVGAVVVIIGVRRRVVLLTESSQAFLHGERLTTAGGSADEIGRLSDKILLAAEMLDDRRRDAIAATRTRDEFLSRVSHELQTPLSAMVNRGIALEDDQRLSEQSKEDAAHIVTAGGHLRGLVDELLDIKAIEAGQLAVAPEELALRPVADEAISLVSPMPASRSITVTADCPDDLVVVADPRRIREVLLNLLSNAVKYNREDGQVDLVARQVDDRVRVEVRDTGPGISPEDQQRLFRPFERLGARDTDVEGSGVGLAVTKRVVEVMGGTIGIDSKVGTGSTFWFDLPAAGTPASPPAATATEPVATPPSRPDHTPTAAAASTAPDAGTAGAAPVDSPLAVRTRTRLGQRWLDAPVRRKLAAVILLVALLCVPPIIVGLTQDRQLTEARRATAESTERVEALDDLQMSTLDAVSALQNLTLLGFDEPAYVEQYRVAIAPIPQELAVIEDDIPAELAPAAEELSGAVDELTARLDALAEIDPAEALEPTGDDRIVFRNTQDTADRVLTFLEAFSSSSAAIDELDQQLRDRLADDRAEASRLQVLLTRTTLASLIAALLAGAGAILLVSRGLVKRIEHLSANGERFVSGQPLLPTWAARDEIGQLSATTQTVAQRLDEQREQAVVATKAKDDFLSRVSHELKTPLTAIIGFAQLLEEDPDLSPEGRTRATEIVTAGHHLHALIEELLDINALEAGRLDITPAPVSVREVATEAIALVEPVATNRTIHLDADVPDDLTVIADHRRLREVLFNLLSNAVKFNHPDGHAHLHATRQNGTVRISVTDTGRGIEPDDQDRVFTPFERLDRGRHDGEHRPVECTGIGLALTKNIVEAMNGSIGLTSTPGRGSTFWVDLPADDERDDPAVTRPSERRDGRSDGAPVGARRSGSPGWR